MPYTVKDVDGFKKGLSDSEKEQWIAVANSVLEKCVEDGGDEGECAAKAIQQASGVLKRGQEEAAADIVQFSGETAWDAIVHHFGLTIVEEEVLKQWLEDPSRPLKRQEASMPNENELDLTNLRELLAQALALVDATLAEQEGDEVAFAESASGYALELAEAEPAQEDGKRAPVEFNLKIIAPGAGNKHDNHWYPADMLKRDANVFEGVDVFVTDHRENERSERTKVGKIKSIIGFTEDGGPIGRTVIYDPELAEKTRNRAQAGELGTLHCSILAHGTAKKGEIDGKKYHIVEAISYASAVDLVSRAGAGGRALSLAESNTGGEPMEEQEQTIEEQEQTPTEEPLEEVTLQEQQEPEEETPAPAMLDQEKVQELVRATNLPEVAKARLFEREYADEAELEGAIGSEVAYVKQLTGSGKPFAQGGGTAPESKPLSEAEKTARFNEHMRTIGAREV